MDKSKISVSDIPELLKEWDYEKNSSQSYFPETTTHKSNKKIWWICELGHSWQDTAGNRSLGRNCPYCSGHRVWIGFNDLLTTHSTLCEEWDYEVNFPHKPTEFSKGSSYKAWWKCPSGHSFQTTIVSRTTKGIGCPYCSGRYAIQGINDLLSSNPSLATEWDYNKNGVLKSENVLPNSSKMAWWICKQCSNSWKAQIKSRNRGNGCPLCGRNKASISKAMPKVGESFADLYPTLLKEWDYEKNTKIDPFKIKPSSVKKVFWKCDKGHRWEARISYRALRNNGCPDCYAPYKSSFPEQAIFYYLSQQFNTISRDSSLGFEFDIFIKDEKIAIEYDGLYWHSSDFAKTMEQRKNEYCRAHQITLYRIKETNDRNNPIEIEGKIIKYYYDTSYTFLDEALNQLFMCIGKDVNKKLTLISNVNKDRIKILSQFEQKQIKNSIFQYSNLVKEWDYEKNKGLLPENVSPGSEIKVHWICEKGHHFYSRVSHRVKGVGCPFCTNKKIIKGENDLESQNPRLAKEWNYEKNENLLPSQVFPSTNRKVWWKCDKNHEWQATINSRNEGRGCPFCAGRVYPKIRCLENDKIYNTYEEIEQELSAKKKNVSQVVHGKRKSTKGFHFEFVEQSIKEKDE